MKSRISSLLVVGFIFAILILSGPVQAFTLNLLLDNNTPRQGETITFTVEIDIDSIENLPIDELILEISGPKFVSCRFDALGSEISGCEGITITRIQNSSYEYDYGYGYYGNDYNFGYGYGYGTGKLAYEISLYTSNYPVGDYDTDLKVTIGEDEFSKSGEDFTIRRRISGDSGSSSSTGGSSACETSWECSEWSSCTNGLETRTCEKAIKSCFAGSAPLQARFCSNEINLLLDNLGNSDSDNLLELNTEDSDESFVSRITGAVTEAVVVGDDEVPNIIFILILFLIGLLSLITVIILFRKI